MNSVVYCRVSTVEQVENLSLRTQEKQCREYCAREGLDVQRVFVDRGESAKSVDRPEFLKLLRYCRENKGKLHTLVVYSLNRFSRNTADHHAIRNLLAGLGIGLRSVTESIDDSPSGRLMESIIAAMAQWDNDVRAERTVAGMREAVSRGRWVWVAPLGYVSTRDKVGPSLKVDPTSAPLITTAFEMYASGATRREVLETVSSAGLRSRRGNPLTPQSLHNLLTNPIYAGRLKATAWDIELGGDFEPLVSDETFRRVQLRLRGRDATPEPRRRDNAEFPLRRFVRCGLCGTPLTGSRSRGRNRTYAYYHCRKRCEGVTVRGHVLHNQFLKLLSTLEPRREYLRLFNAVVLDSWQSERRRTADVCSARERRLTQIRERIQRLEEAFLFQRTIDQRTYDDQLVKLREELTLAEIERNAAQMEQVDVEGILAFAQHVLSNAAALWSNADSTDRRALQQAFFPSGLDWTPTGFGTALTSSAFRYLQEATSGKSNVASPEGFDCLQTHIERWIAA